MSDTPKLTDNQALYENARLHCLSELTDEQLRLITDEQYNDYLWCKHRLAGIQANLIRAQLIANGTWHTDTYWQHWLYNLYAELEAFTKSLNTRREKAVKAARDE